MNNSSLLISIMFLNIICISLLCASIQKSKASPVPETVISTYEENTEISESETATKETTTKATTTAAQTTTAKVTDPYVKRNLGNFDLTFYVPDDTWGYSTSTGVKSQHLTTCAVDPNVIPLGSVIQITGDNGQVLKLKCVDIGNLVVGNKIDIFYDSYNYNGVQAGYDWLAKFGTVQEVYLLEE